MWYNLSFLHQKKKIYIDIKISICIEESLEIFLNNVQRIEQPQNKKLYKIVNVLYK